MNYLRALRLAFLPASLLPYALGVAYATRSCALSVPRVILGGAIVALAHLSANLINDYADSRLGADWQDLKCYTFFGGSKLIQLGILSEKWYRNAACILYAAFGVLLFVFTLLCGPWYVLPLGILIAALSVQYSAPPLVLSYRGLGELTVMLLFGPAVVCGAYVMATGQWFDFNCVLLSAPVALWIGALLLCNEIADIRVDGKVGKRTLAVRLGLQRARGLYALTLVGAAALVVVAGMAGLVRYSWLPACLTIVIAYCVYRLIGKWNGDPAEMRVPACLNLTGHGATLLFLLVSQFDFS